jgi:hypothetical protein
MSIFADREDSVWSKNLPPDILQGYLQDNRKYITPTHDCLRTILTKKTPHQMIWLKHWMKCGGVLDQLWISPTSTAANIHVLSILEILRELNLTDDTMNFFANVRAIFECMWLRHSKEIAKNVLSTMDPKLREALLLANFEGPTGKSAPLVMHAIGCDRTHLAQLFLLTNHGNNDDIFKMVLAKNKKHWIAWFLRNELSNKCLAIDYLVKTNNVTELYKLPSRSSKEWLQRLHSAIPLAIANNSTDCLEWLLKNGADPNCEAMTTCTPEILKVFLEYGADPNMYPLDCYEKESWRILLEHGARAVLKQHIIEDWVIMINSVYDKIPFKMDERNKKLLEDLFQKLSNVLGPCATTQQLYTNIENILYPEGFPNAEDS